MVSLVSHPKNLAWEVELFLTLVAASVRRSTFGSSEHPRPTPVMTTVQVTGPEIRNPKTQNPNPKTQTPETPETPETRNPSPSTQPLNPELYNLHSHLACNDDSAGYFAGMANPQP